MSPRNLPPPAVVIFRPLSSLPRAERERREMAIALAIDHLLRPDQKARLAAHVLTAVGA